MEVQKTYLPYIDVARGIGVALVVFSHAIIPAMRAASAPLMALWNGVYAFHITLFFIISGFCYELGLETSEPKPFWAFCRGRAKQLLLPYLVYSVLVYVAIDGMSMIPAFSRILGGSGYGFVPPLKALVQILDVETHMDRHMWFLPCLFFVSVFSRAVGRQGKRPWLFSLLLLINMLPMTFGPLEYFRTAMGYSVAYTLGRLLAGCRERAFSGAWWKPVAAGGLFGLFYWLKSWVFSYITIDTALGKCLFTFIGYGCAISGAMAVLFLARCIPRCAAMAYLGKRAFPVYLFHQPFFTSGVAGLLYTALSVPVLPAILLAAITGIGLSLAAESILSKGRLTSLLLLGKGRTTCGKVSGEHGES